jgi:hypothetical protein
MKKIIPFLLTVSILISFDQNRLQAAPVTKGVENPQGKIEAQQLINRLEEINAMDKSTLTTKEKRALRKEVRSIEHKLREISGGVYISAGALILILLLVLILF